MHPQRLSPATHYPLPRISGIGIISLRNALRYFWLRRLLLLLLLQQLHRAVVPSVMRNDPIFLIILRRFALISLLQHFIDASARCLGFLAYCAVSNPPDDMACIYSCFEDNPISHPPGSASPQLVQTRISIQLTRECT